MAILEATVAFALTMLILSTAVSAFVEAVFHRLLNLRYTGFRHMIESIFDEVVWPRLKERLARARPGDPGLDQAAERAAFCAAVLRNPTVREVDGGCGYLTLAWRRVARYFVPGRVEKLTTVEFVERIAETEVGRAIHEAGQAQMAVLVDDLALKFERFGEQSRAHFRQRAYAASIIASILFALFANIDATRIFDIYLKEPGVRQSMLARADAAVAAYERLEQDRTTRQRDPNTGLQASVDPDVQAMVDQTKADLAKLQREIESLGELGLPLGVGFYPRCTVEVIDEKRADVARAAGRAVVLPKSGAGAKRYVMASADPLCEAFLVRHAEAAEECTSVAEDTPYRDCVAAEFGFRAALTNDTAGVFQSLLLMLLSGILIGLGGPFWFNVFSNLNQVLQLARAVGGVFRAKPKETPEDPNALPSSDEGAQKPKTPVEAFERAARAREFEWAGGARVPLSDFGDPIYGDKP